MEVPVQQGGEYAVYSLPDEAPEAGEPLGARSKFWYSEPAFGPSTDGRGVRSLFKEGKLWSGENASEKAAFELARLMGLPVARQELATYMGRRGTASPTFLEESESLVTGDLLLASLIAGYPREEKVPASHTVANIAGVLGQARPHPTLRGVPELRTAAHQFVGYLLFDVWIGNMDRHHRNWALVETAGGGAEARYLAPTHDHGSSLGRELTPAKKLQMLDAADAAVAMMAYATSSKAKGRMYRDPRDDRALTSLGAYLEAANLYGDAAAYWMQRLDAIPDPAVAAVFDLFPETWMSVPARRFAFALLQTNRLRLAGATPP